MVANPNNMAVIEWKTGAAKQKSIDNDQLNQHYAFFLEQILSVSVIQIFSIASL